MILVGTPIQTKISKSLRVSCRVIQASGFFLSYPDRKSHEHDTLDTRYYWNLTRHIFRYNHNHGVFSGGKLQGGIHTVNEGKSIPTAVEFTN